jgi:WD40 repeat protein
LAKLFDPQGMLELETLNGCGGRVSSVAFQPGEGLLATGSADPAVRLWRPDSGELLRELDGHEQGVSDVAFSSDGELLASSSSDGRVIVRETGDFERVATLEHGAAIRRIAFHPVADRIATVDNSNTLRLWDARSGSEIWRRVSPASLHSVEFSPDGRRLATGEGDFNGERVGIGLWSAATGEALRTLQGHTEVVYDVRFSPDGSRLASASADGTVRLWDPERAIELLALTGHESWVFCVAFSPDGYLLASGGGNYGGVGAGVRVWDSR